jgi:hypothetical protein
VRTWLAPVPVVPLSLADSDTENAQDNRNDRHNPNGIPRLDPRRISLWIEDERTRDPTTTTTTTTIYTAWLTARPAWQGLRQRPDFFAGQEREEIQRLRNENYELCRAMRSPSRRRCSR